MGKGNDPKDVQNGDNEDCADFDRPYRWSHSTHMSATKQFDSTYGIVSGRQWCLREADRYNALNPRCKADMGSDGKGDVWVRMWHYPPCDRPFGHEVVEIDAPRRRR